MGSCAAMRLREPPVATTTPRLSSTLIKTGANTNWWCKRSLIISALEDCSHAVRAVHNWPDTANSSICTHRSPLRPLANHLLLLLECSIPLQPWQASQDGKP